MIAYCKIGKGYGNVWRTYCKLWIAYSLGRRRQIRRLRFPSPAGKSCASRPGRLAGGKLGQTGFSGPAFGSFSNFCRNRSSPTHASCNAGTPPMLLSTKIAKRRLHIVSPTRPVSLTHGGGGPMPRQIGPNTRRMGPNVLRAESRDWGTRDNYPHVKMSGVPTKEDRARDAACADGGRRRSIRACSRSS